jgi:hypothetical protein
MFHIRKIQSTAIAAMAMCCFAAVVTATEPDVSYASAGIFATNVISGEDGLELAGQPFTLLFVVNEGTKPIRHSETTAEYNNILVDFTFASRAGEVPQGFSATVTLVLQVGAPGQPDWFIVQFPFTYGGLPLIITAKIMMPAGTLAKPAIESFAAPVTLTPSSGTVTYACPACPPPNTGKSTTLAIRAGALVAIAQ